MTAYTTPEVDNLLITSVLVPHASSITLDAYTAGCYTLTPTGNFSLDIKGFVAGVEYAQYLHLYLVNGGAHTITWNALVVWIKPDGTPTVSIVEYLAANTGRTALQSSGIDQFVFWHKNGVTNGKLV